MIKTTTKQTNESKLDKKPTNERTNKQTKQLFPFLSKFPIKIRERDEAFFPAAGWPDRVSAFRTHKSRKEKRRRISAGRIFPDHSGRPADQRKHGEPEGGGGGGGGGGEGGVEEAKPRPRLSRQSQE